MSGRGIALYPASLDPIHYGHIDVAIRASRFFRPDHRRHL